MFYAYAALSGCYLNSNYYRNNIKFFWNNSTCQENIDKTRIMKKQVQKEVDKDSLDGKSVPSDVLQTTKLSLPRMMTYFSKYRKSNSTNNSFNTNVTNSL